MSNHIRERSGGEIVGLAFDLYKQNFALIFFTYLLSLFPLRFLQSLLIALSILKGFKWFVLFRVLIFLSDLIAWVLLTVIVSDIYQGYIPSLKRALRRVSAVLLVKASVTDLLGSLAIISALFLFIVPGVAVYTLFMFYLPVVVLEGVWGIAAFRRSIRLGRNYYLRNLFMMLLLYVIVMLAAYLFSFVLYIRFANRPWIAISFQVLIFCAIEPILIIRTVLLYYDMLIRNEAYDITAMAEELKR